MAGENKNGLFIASDVVETAKEFQFALSFEAYEDRPEKAAEAIDIIGDPRELVGGRHVIVHALGAYVFHDSLSSDAELFHGAHLTDVTLKSEFSRLAFVNDRKLSAICLYLFCTKVLKSREDVYEGAEIASGIFVPVHEVESVWAA